MKTQNVTVFDLLDREEVWEWGYTREDNRYVSVKALVDFKIKYGRTPRRNNPTDSKMMNRWNNITVAALKGLVPTPLMSLLSEHGLMRKTEEQRWRAKILALRTFVAKYKKFPTLRSAYLEERALSNFVARQRRRKKRGTLSITRIQDLDSIPGFEWEPHRGSRGPK